MHENEEINKIITEKLFGDCWHEFLYQQNRGLVCRICARLKRTISKDQLNKDFSNSDADIREARERIAEKGLQKEFRNALILEVGLYESHKWDYLKSQEIVDFDLIHSKPIFQARAICRVLEGLK